MPETAKKKRNFGDQHRSRAQHTVRIPVSLISPQDTYDLVCDNVKAAGLPVQLESMLLVTLKRAQSLFKNLPENEQAVCGHIDIAFVDLERYLKAISFRGGSLRRLRDKFFELEKWNLVQIRSLSARSFAIRVAGHQKASLFIIDTSFANENFKTQVEEFVQQATKGQTTNRRMSKQKLAQVIKEQRGQVLSYEAGQITFTEGIICGLTDIVQRENSANKKDIKVLEGERNVLGVAVRLTSTTSTHPQAELKAWNDQPIARALITLIVKQIDEFVDDKVKDILGRNSGWSSPAQSWRSEAQSSLFDPMIEDAQYEEIPPVSSTSKGKEIGMLDGNDDLDDLQTQYDQQIEEAKAQAIRELENNFLLDVGDLALAIGIQAPDHLSGGAKRGINWSLRRLRDTNYHISLHHQDVEQILRVQKTLGLRNRVTEIGLISGLKSEFDADFLSPFVDHAGDPEKILQEIDNDSNPYSDMFMERTRYWRVQLDHDIFKSLLDKTARKLFKSHPMILRDRHGLSQAMYNFFCQIIGKVNMAIYRKPDRCFDKPISVLRDRLCPGRELYDFRGDLVRVLKQHSKDSEGVLQWDSSLKFNHVRMWGFEFVLLDRNAEAREENPDIHYDLWIHVRRDKSDKHFGDQSQSNNYLAQKEGRPNIAKKLPTSSFNESNVDDEYLMDHLKARQFDLGYSALTQD